VIADGCSEVDECGESTTLSQFYLIRESGVFVKDITTIVTIVSIQLWSSTGSCLMPMGRI